MIMRIIRWFIFFCFTMGLVGGTALIFAGYLMYQKLPELTELTNYRPKIPLRVYSSEGSLIAEFGEERRDLVKIKEIPEKMKQAILSAEDERFYEHSGVDFWGILRAAISNVMSRGAKEGASTITMQVARNFYLSTEKTLTRKLNEILLSFKIENDLSKDQILEVYLNQIYLGQRAYGFGSASHIYFGKDISKLSIAEMAMLAGLPKAPSKFNPVVNPSRSKYRQLYVLKRMKMLNFITQDEYDKAQRERLQLRSKGNASFSELQADYVAEMVRIEISKRYSKDIYNSGLRVYTTIKKDMQEEAHNALWKGIFDYDRRHGYRGIEDLFELPADADDETLEGALQEYENINFLIPAIVLDVKPKLVKAYIRGTKMIEIKGEGLKFSQNLKDSDKKIQRGALIRVYQRGDGSWEIGQLPEVEAALVAVEPEDGSIRALAGGFSFTKNKFNHVTQALRQPGSSFKPFIYSAALEKGMTAGDYISDSPVEINGWTPKNYDGGYSGPISMRKALVKSKNLVTVRILQQIGISYARDYITRFGFKPENHPPYPTIALGAGQTTPLELSGAYSVFANGGHRVIPHIIDYITDSNGKRLYEEKVPRAGVDAEKVIDPRNVYIMTSIMKDVVKMGTAAEAGRVLKRPDFAGKTGTTNDQHDAWFAGFNPRIVAVAWMGYDKPQNLGEGESGGHTALPIWINFMKNILGNIPVAEYAMPQGVVQSGGEYYYSENARPSGSSGNSGSSKKRNSSDALNDSTSDEILSGGGGNQEQPAKSSEFPSINEQ